MLAAAFLIAGLSAASLFAEKPGQKGATYLGAAKCKMCHMKQYKAWEKMKHSKNFASLVGPEKKNPECLKCHTTGFGVGGYDVSKSAAENKKFENVQCESCHGPGSKHFKAPKAQRKSTIEMKTTACANCHNPHRKFGAEAKAKR